MKTETIKLTQKQNAVIWCLQNGWVFITSSEYANVLVCNNTHQYWIRSQLFWNLVKKGLIYQSNDWGKDRFGYILTPLGRQIKTKPVTF